MVFNTPAKSGGKIHSVPEPLGFALFMARKLVPHPHTGGQYSGGGANGDSPLKVIFALNFPAY
jgi:hypothetical protein